MTAEEQIDFIHFLLNRWKEERLEVIAYNLVFNAIKEKEPEVGKVLESSLENARNSPAIQNFLESRFAALEEMIRSMGEGTLEKALREFQERAGSKYPIN
jgi:hypothetical protein